MAKPRARLSRDRVKAAKTRVAAAEAFASAVKFQAAGKIKAAHNAMQTAIQATKESLNLQYPWTARDGYSWTKFCAVECAPTASFHSAKSSAAYCLMRHGIAFSNFLAGSRQ